jgi:hypothetical protein
MRRFFYFLIFILFISGCARTVTSPLKKIVEVSFTLEDNITFTDDNYYLVIAFNSNIYEQPNDNLSTWKNFFVFKKEITQYKFFKGKDGNLNNLNPVYFEIYYDEDLKNFDLKIPLKELYEDGIEPKGLYINIFYISIGSDNNLIFQKYLFQAIYIEIIRGNQIGPYNYSGFLKNLIVKFY